MSVSPLIAGSFVHDHGKWIIEIPVRIVVTIVIGLLVRWALHRAIDRLIKPVRTGEVPRILRPFKDKVEGHFSESSTTTARRAQRAATLGTVLKSTVSFLLAVLVVLLVLSDLEVDLAPFLAGTSIVGVAVGFGAQSLVKDFLAGIFMTLEDQYGVGDVIDFQQASGTVESVGLRTTKLRDVNGTAWYVRNGEVVRVGNKSQGYAQVVLDIPVDATADLTLASSTILNTAQQLRSEQDWADCFLSAPEVQGVESLTRDEAVLRMVVRVKPLEQWRIARELRKRIHLALEAVRIPSSAPAEDEATTGSE